MVVQEVGRVLPSSADADWCLVADIGATSSRFGVVSGGELLCEEVFASDSCESLAKVAWGVLARNGLASQPGRGALAVAASVLGDWVQFTNHRWSFSQAQLRKQLGLRAGLRVVNDLVAVAYALPWLRKSEVIGEGSGRHGAYPMGVLAPGTGLGMAGLVPVEGGWQALASEGGHVAMAFADPLEREVLTYLQHESGYVSAEQVASGRGLENIHRALLAVESQSASRPSLSAADITQAAEGGNRLCQQAVALLCAFLGTAASGLALTLGAHGGIYLAGGLLAKVANLFDRELFRKRFVGQSCCQDYLSRIPTYLITHPLPAFLGLQALLKYDPQFFASAGDDARLPLLCVPPRPDLSLRTGA